MIPSYQMHNEENTIKPKMAKIDIFKLSPKLRGNLLKIYIINHVSDELDIDSADLNYIMYNIDISSDYVNVPIYDEKSNYPGYEPNMYSILPNSVFTINKDCEIVNNLLTLMIEELVTRMYSSNNIDNNKIDKNKIIDVIEDFYAEYYDYNFKFNSEE